MKIYLIDKYNILNKISKELEKLEIGNIERKENCKFKMTKNDCAIISDKDDFDGADKLKNLIVIVENKDYKHIWNLTNYYRTIDILDYSLPIQYMAQRICKDIGEKI